MDIAFYEINPQQAALFLSPGILTAAAGIWLMVASGLVGRAALYLEEKAHRPEPTDKGTHAAARS